MALESASKVLDALCGYLDQNGLNYDKLPEKNQVVCPLKKAGISFIVLGVAKDGGVFAWFAICAQRGEERVRRELVAFTTLVNTSVLLGNFVVDLSDGEVRYKTGACVKNIRKYVVVASECEC